MTLRIGSLFSGYAGLDHAVETFYGAETAWFSDIDKGACKILAHRYPDTPNLGDITKIDWTAVEPVDIITGGSPCQDLSHAGKRGGMTGNTRSNLWVSMREAIAALRPQTVVWENVRGAYSAGADSDLGPCPGCMDDPRQRGPVLRALGRVLGDLSSLGYDCRWQGIRASDVGAPHGRFRVFVVATDATNDGRPRGGSARRGRTGLENHRVTTANASGQRHGRGQDGGALGPVDGDAAGEAPERQRSRQVVGDRGAAVATDAKCVGLEAGRRPSRCTAEVARIDDGIGSLPVSWGDYGPAVARWESVIGRVAPAPTETSTKGGQRLSPAFVEWMMGLPLGHVTAVPGLSRNDQLKALGNGVVPQQAYAALAMMA